jgi:hypothetical protein
MFITFLPSFAQYRDTLASKKPRSDVENHILSSVDLLISTFHSDWSTTLTKLAKFKAHGEISFDFLQYLLVPRTLFVGKCTLTGNLRLFKLMYSQRTSLDGVMMYQLICESVDLIDKQSGQNGVMVGKVQTQINLKYFKGATRIEGLNAYPLEFHPEKDRVMAALKERGKKWRELIGCHHMQYKGLAAIKFGDRIVKQSVSLLSDFKVIPRLTVFCYRSIAALWLIEVRISLLAPCFLSTDQLSVQLLSARATRTISSRPQSFHL